MSLPVIFLIIAAIAIPTFIAFVLLLGLKKKNELTDRKPLAFWRFSPLLIAAVASGLSAYLIIGYGGSIASFAPAQGTSRITLSTFDGLYDVGPHVATMFPAEWQTSIRVDAPPSSIAGSTYEIKLHLTQRGMGSTRYARGTYIASLDGPPHTRRRGIPPCNPGKLNINLTNAASASGTVACNVISSNSHDLNFRWLIDTRKDQTGNLLHNLSIAGLQAFPSTRASLRKLQDSGTGNHPGIFSQKFDKSVEKFSLNNLVGEKIDTREPWSFHLRFNNQSVKATDPERPVRLGDIEVDLLAETIIIPVEILTQLGLSESVQSWLQVIGAICAALLTAGAGGWIFGMLRARTGT